MEKDVDHVLNALKLPLKDPATGAAQHNIFWECFVNDIVVNPSWEGTLHLPSILLLCEKGLLHEGQDSNLELRGLQRDVVYLIALV